MSANDGIWWTHMHRLQQATFIVIDTATPEVAIFDFGLEGRRIPELERVYGLDIVVPVYEHRGRASWRVQPISVHYWVGSTGRQNSRVLQGDI